MGIFDWLFGKQEPARIPVANAPEVSFGVSVVVSYEGKGELKTYTTEIDGHKIRAEVPVEQKAVCDKILRKKDWTREDRETMYETYWVDFYVDGDLRRHGYHGNNDNFTYDAQKLPYISQVNDWMYSLLGISKPLPDSPFETINNWQHYGDIYVLGRSGTVLVEMSFKPRGWIVTLVMTDERDVRREKKASIDMKNSSKSEYWPYYYAGIREQIKAWVKKEYDQRREQPKSALRSTGN